MIKKMIMLMAAALALLSARGQQVSFTDWGMYEPITITLSENQSSLNKIFVVYDTQGVGMTYKANSNEPVIWISYDYRGGVLHTDTIRDIIYNGVYSKLPQVGSDIGYVIVEGTSTHYYWVVNYADHYLDLYDLFFDNENPCDLVTLHVDGHGDAITYYEPGGAHYTLDREIKLKYNSLVFVDDDHWEETVVIDTLATVDHNIEILPPLCNTEFQLWGDRFLEYWNIASDPITSDYYTSMAVGFATTAELEKYGEYTLLDHEVHDLSAPAHLVFTGYPTDAVVYRVWELARDMEFEDVILQNNQDEVDYTFYESGTFYMRYLVADASGTCQKSDVYTITVEEVVVPDPKAIPNVFSPGTTPGANDIWRVKTKSLIEFHCWIYNRWGTLVYEYTDPDGGWDGKYRGQYVDTGVYYFVFTATGSNGKKYTRHGDITVMRYKGTRGGVPGSTELPDNVGN